MYSLNNFDIVMAFLAANFYITKAGINAHYQHILEFTKNNPVSEMDLYDFIISTAELFMLRKSPYFVDPFDGEIITDRRFVPKIQFNPN